MFIFYGILESKLCSYLFVHVSLFYWSFVQLFLQVSAGAFWSLLCIRDIPLFKALFMCQSNHLAAAPVKSTNPNFTKKNQIPESNHKKLKKNDEHYMNTMNN